MELLGSSRASSRYESDLPFRPAIHLSKPHNGDVHWAEAKINASQSRAGTIASIATNQLAGLLRFGLTHCYHALWTFNGDGRPLPFSPFHRQDLAVVGLGRRIGRSPYDSLR